MTIRASITVTPLKCLVANNPFAISLFLELVFAPIIATSSPLFLLSDSIRTAGFSFRFIGEAVSPSAGKPGSMNSGARPSLLNPSTRLAKSWALERLRLVSTMVAFHTAVASPRLRIIMASVSFLFCSMVLEI